MITCHISGKGKTSFVKAAMNSIEALDRSSGIQICKPIEVTMTTPKSMRES